MTQQYSYQVSSFLWTCLLLWPNNSFNQLFLNLWISGFYLFFLELLHVLMVLRCRKEKFYCLIIIILYYHHSSQQQQKKKHEFSSPSMKCLGYLWQYSWLLTSFLCLIISVNKERQSVTANNESINGHVRWKMTREMVTNYSVYEYCTKFQFLFLIGIFSLKW